MSEMSDLIEKVINQPNRMLIARAVGMVDGSNIILELIYDGKDGHYSYGVFAKNENRGIMEVSIHELREDAEKEFDELVDKYKLKINMPEKKWWKGGENE